MDTYRVTKSQTVAVGKKAVSVPAGYRHFLVKNTGANPVYMREAEDGKAATVADGWPLSAGETMPHVLTGEVFSLVAAEDGGEVRFLWLDMG